MTELLAHLVLHGRHQYTVTINGVHWRYCSHRSHRLNLRCWRWFVYDGYCGHHNASCYIGCPTEDT